MSGELPRPPEDYAWLTLYIPVNWRDPDAVEAAADAAADTVRRQARERRAAADAERV